MMLEFDAHIKDKPMSCLFNDRFNLRPESMRGSWHRANFKESVQTMSKKLSGPRP